MADDKILTLDVPQREGKEGYIGMLFGLYLKMGSVLADANFNETDRRVEYMTHFMISLVPGKENRREIRDALKKDIEERTKDAKTDEARAKIRNQICIEYIGNVMDFTDKHIGISQKMEIILEK